MRKNPESNTGIRMRNTTVRVLIRSDITKMLNVNIHTIPPTNIYIFDDEVRHRLIKESVKSYLPRTYELQIDGSRNEKRRQRFHTMMARGGENNDTVKKIFIINALNMKTNNDEMYAVVSVRTRNG